MTVCGLVLFSKTDANKSDSYKSLFCIIKYAFMKVIVKETDLKQVVITVNYSVLQHQLYVYNVLFAYLVSTMLKSKSKLLFRQMSSPNSKRLHCFYVFLVRGKLSRHLNWSSAFVCIHDLIISTHTSENLPLC